MGAAEVDRHGQEEASAWAELGRSLVQGQRLMPFAVRGDELVAVVKDEEGSGRVIDRGGSSADEQADAKAGKLEAGDCRTLGGGCFEEEAFAAGVPGGQPTLLYE